MLIEVSALKKIAKIMTSRLLNTNLMSAIVGVTTFSSVWFHVTVRTWNLTCLLVVGGWESSQGITKCIHTTTFKVIAGVLKKGMVQLAL